MGGGSVCIDGKSKAAAGAVYPSAASVQWRASELACQPVRRRSGANAGADGRGQGWQVEAEHKQMSVARFALVKKSLPNPEEMHLQTLPCPKAQCRQEQLRCGMQLPAFLHPSANACFLLRPLFPTQAAPAPAISCIGMCEVRTDISISSIAHLTFASDVADVRAPTFLRARPRTALDPAPSAFHRPGIPPPPKMNSRLRPRAQPFCWIRIVSSCAHAHTTPFRPHDVQTKRARRGMPIYGLLRRKGLSTTQPDPRRQ